MRDLESVVLCSGTARVTAGPSPGVADLTQKGPLVVSLAIGGTPADGELVFTVPGSFGTDTVLLGEGRQVLGDQPSPDDTIVFRVGTKTGTTIPFTVHNAANDAALDLTSSAVLFLDFIILGLV
jgi:hypothetical protein